MSAPYWEEDFIVDDLAKFFDENGKQVGEVARVGGSWQCRVTI